MNAEVVVGVGGGIAAYKACELVRRLRESGHNIRVVPTPAALNFVGAVTWEALSGNPVRTSVFEDVYSVAHVDIGKHADLVVIAPATANVLAKAATGQATDLLTATLLMTHAPVIFAPAMHTEMWEHPATVANVATLKQYGNIVVSPASGRLTGADTGPGRLPEPASIADVCEAVLARSASGRDLAGIRILISAGGTREAIDPVRFIGNRSSGKQGWALAAAAVARGAEVTVVAANVDAPDPAGVTVLRVGDADGLHKAVAEAATEADVVIMAAAVADFRPNQFADSKIKKTDGEPKPLVLSKTTDVLAELGANRPPNLKVLVGFAAETVGSEAELADLAIAKRERKQADLIVANAVGRNQGFENADNAVSIFDASGLVKSTANVSKFQTAQAVLDAVAAQI